MMQTVYTCDHCGKTLNEMVDFADVDMDDLNEWFSTDLCATCYKELTALVMGFCGKKPMEQDGKQ